VELTEYKSFGALQMQCSFFVESMVMVYTVPVTVRTVVPGVIFH